MSDRGRIVALRPRQKPARCERCGFSLASSPSWWRLCARCFAGAQLARALELYQAVRP